MVGAQARRPCRRGAVRVARGAAGRPRRGGGLGALHWHFVLGCCGDGVGCEGLPFVRAWRAVLPKTRRRRSFVNPLMLRGDGSPALQRGEGQRLSRTSPPLDFGYSGSGSGVSRPVLLSRFAGFRIKTSSSRGRLGASFVRAHSRKQTQRMQPCRIFCAPVDVGSRCSVCAFEPRESIRAQKAAALHTQTRAKKARKKAYGIENSRTHRYSNGAQK